MRERKYSLLMSNAPAHTVISQFFDVRDLTTTLLPECCAIEGRGESRVCMLSVHLNRAAGDVVVITAWFVKTFRISRTSEEQKQPALIDRYL